MRGQRASLLTDNRTYSFDRDTDFPVSGRLEGSDRTSHGLPRIDGLRLTPEAPEHLHEHEHRSAKGRVRSAKAGWHLLVEQSPPPRICCV